MRSIRKRLLLLQLSAMLLVSALALGGAYYRVRDVFYEMQDYHLQQVALLLVQQGDLADARAEILEPEDREIAHLAPVRGVTVRARKGRREDVDSEGLAHPAIVNLQSVHVQSPHETIHHRQTGDDDVHTIRAQARSKTKISASLSAPSSCCRSRPPRPRSPMPSSF